MAVRDDKFALLKDLTHFDGVADRVLRSLTSHVIANRLERGDRLWREGSRASNFTFLVDGHVKRIKQRGDDRQTIVQLHRSGSGICHTAVLEELARPATAIALADTHLLQIHRSHLIGTLRNEPTLTSALLGQVSANNHALTRRLHDVTVSDAEQRLALLFAHLTYSSGTRRKQEDGEMAIEIPIPLSRSDLAQLINTRVETAIRLMSKWRDAEMVTTLDTGFYVHDAETIQQKAGPTRDELQLPYLQ